jgi:hypothetical protein
MMKSDETMVRLLIRGFTILSKLLGCFRVSKGMSQAISFTSKNLKRINDEGDEKVWKEVRFAGDVPIDTLSRLGVELLWMANKLNVQINQTRSAMGYMQVNFEREAIAYDLEVEAGRKEANE